MEKRGTSGIKNAIVWKSERRPLRGKNVCYVDAERNDEFGEG